MVFVFMMVIMLTLLTSQLKLTTLTQYGLQIIIFYIIIIPLFLWLRRGLKWFIFGSSTFIILLTFWTILKLGGITYSGGLIFVGLVTVFYTKIYPSTRLLLWSFSLYIITFILAAVLQPRLVPAPEMTLQKNLIMFVINSLWMSANILLLIYYIFGKEAELARLKSQRLQETDDLKTRLFANIAHEFRTPLTLINGMTELMHDNPHQQIRERAEIVRQNANKVLRLVDQMLNLAMLEAGSMPIHTIQSDVNAFLRYIFHSYKGLSEYRQVRLHFLPEAEQYIMDFDPEKLEELVGNLLSNALKYTPAGGDVYFSSHASGNEPEQFIIKVKDTGIGISEDKLGYIFDRFYRVENKEKHYEEGSGIGLTLVREYVKLLGGEISVESKPGQGTEFTVVLPVTRDAPIQESLTIDTEPDISTASAEINWTDEENHDSSLPQILIIEDNPEVIQYLHLILGDKFRLVSAGNGDDGINQALEHIPDLILSDVMMPGKDGFEVCRTLKKDFRTCHIPIVLLTARADRASRITGLEHGADAYLTKPFDKQELLVCLRNQLTQREKLRIKYVSHHSDHAPEPTAGFNEVFLKNLKEILEKDYALESFGIEELCTALGISRVQLHRKLIALTGQSASHFIRSFRLEKAKDLLLKTSKSVSEIAYDTGFSDANYFSRVFSQEFGAPPSDLRKGTEARG
jgi:signal transduction histidine kinase/DNA-binding response OmpR family regulator